MPKLLPHYLKFIAFPIGAICIIGLLLTATLASSIQADETVIEWVLKDLLLISLIITAFSQEREESPGINKIRLRELMHAVGFGVIMLLYD